MALRDYLGLIVPEFIPMGLMSALVGAVLTTGFLPGFEFLFAIVAVIFVVGAFNAFNAIADKEIDKINKLDRPVPAKRISDGQALWFAITLYFLALSLAFFVNTTFFLLTFFAVVITAAYSYPGIDLKKKFIIGNLTVTVFYAILCPLLGWALYPANPMPLPMIFFMFFMGLSLSISKDFTDVPGDLVHGANTIPAKLGQKHSIGIIFALLFFAYIFLFFLVNQHYIKEKNLALLIFFPLMLFNVNEFRKNHSMYKHSSLFLKTVLLIISLETAIILIELF